MISKIMTPQRCPYPHTMFPYMAKRDLGLCDSITLSWRDYPGLTKKAQCNHDGPYKDLNQIPIMKLHFPPKQPRTPPCGWSRVGIPEAVSKVENTAMREQRSSPGHPHLWDR